MTVDRPALRRALLAWYRRNARDLPWRAARDPYAVWLSEIMLQQTRVETVLRYYEPFLAAYPSVQALAAAPLERVLARWAGLGYYRRARNLHAAARLIAGEFGGAFPRSPSDLQRLPGIGRYTAAAIASIAFGEPAAVLDGNVQRVLARLFAVEIPPDEARGCARLWELADALLARRNPGDFNQALMELGARVCTPTSPRCGCCPVRRWCAAFAQMRVDELPAPRRRRDAPLVEAAAAVVLHAGRLLLERRPDDGLLAGLWRLPEVPWTPRRTAARLRDKLRELLGASVSVRVGRTIGTVEHAFTHRRLRLHVVRCQIEAAPTGSVHDGRRARRSSAAPPTDPPGNGSPPSLQWRALTRCVAQAVSSVDRKALRMVVDSAGSRRGSANSTIRPGF